MVYVNGDEPYYLRPTAKVIQVGIQKVFFLGGARVLYFYGDVVPKIINPLVECLNTGSIINNLFTDPTLLSEALDILNSLSSNCLIQRSSPQIMQPEISNYLTFRFSPLNNPIDLKAHQLNNFSAINFFSSGIDRIFTGCGTFFGVNYASYPNDEQKFIPGADSVFFCSDNGSINMQFSCSVPGILDVHISGSVKQSSMFVHSKEAIAGPNFSLLAHCILLVLAGITPPKIIRRSYENSLLGTVNPDPFIGKEYFDSQDLTEQFGHYQAINEICLFSAGTIFQNNKIRRISPSAGDLRTIHCVYLSNEIQDEIGVWVLIMGSGFMEKVSVICDPDLCSYIRGTAGILAYSATAGGLRIKYKELAYRLAFYDSGVAVGYAKRLAGMHSMSAENLDSETIQKISNQLSFISKNNDNFISAGLKLYVNTEQDKFRESHLSKDFWRAAMLRRRSVRQFDPVAPESSALDVLENRYLDLENVFSEMDMDTLAPNLIRIQKVEGLYSEYKIRTINIRTRTVSTSYSHISLISSFNHIVRQYDLSLAPVVYLVAYAATSNALFPEELIWQFTSETLASLWLLAESCGLKGTLCGDTYTAALVNDFDPYFVDKLSLCLGLAPKQNSEVIFETY